MEGGELEEEPEERQMECEEDDDKENWDPEVFSQNTDLSDWVKGLSYRSKRSEVLNRS